MNRSGRIVAVVLALAVAALGGVVGVAGAAPPDDDRWGPGRGHGGGMGMDRPTESGRGMGGMGAMGGGMRHMAVADEAEYLAAMIPHHEEAVTAARELARSERPEMRALGESIDTTQTAEIEQMRAWLDTWYPEVEPADDQPMMRDLTGLEGDALDRAFLQDMVMHHMMAVMMSRQLLARGLAEHDAVADFAAQVRDAQRAEIVTMRTWLAEWFDAGCGHGSPGWAGHRAP